jgi:hypothetical protein
LSKCCCGIFSHHPDRTIHVQLVAQSFHLPDTLKIDDQRRSLRGRDRLLERVSRFASRTAYRGLLNCFRSNLSLLLYQAFDKAFGGFVRIKAKPGFQPSPSSFFAIFPFIVQ